MKSFTQWTLGILLLGGLAYFFGIAPGRADRRLNSYEDAPPYHVADSARALHDRLSVADLHADFLLWNRSALQRNDYGHIDIPRLIDANVALQVFAAVTKVPYGRSYEGTAGDSDKITLLAIAQLWPISSWFDLTERALYQARRLHRIDRRAGETFTVLESREDLAQYLRRRKNTPNMTAGLLAIEGLHALEGEIDNVDRFYEAGFRMMSLTHMFDNRLAGSAQGLEQGGLTAFGEKVVRRMNELDIIIDLAHLSGPAIDDVLALTNRPVVVSHTGIQGTCDSPRNLSDRQIRQVAKTGGVIGVGLWERAVCGVGAAHIVRAIRHVVDLVGVDHAALGSDFDGTVHTPFDVTGLPKITERLIAAGFSSREIGMIMGGNTLRVVEETLPRNE